MPEPTVAEVRDADWQCVLDEELGRLPGHYRGVIILCDLEGMTRKEAARQLAIPEGSVASRLARARVMLAKRLTRRGVVFSGGSVAAVLSAGMASASASPALVASTIKVASLLAAGKAAATGMISAKVAALTKATVKAMFVTKIQSVLAGVLVIAALAGAAGLTYQTQAADQPKAMEEHNGKAEKTKDARQPTAQPKPQPAKSDQERMIGNWFIMNDDSMRKGEMWVITEDSILMHAKDSGPITQRYAHRLDAAKSPKQIDINVSKVNGPPVGVIKGIYALEGDELRLCLGEMGKDRAAAFPKEPGPGEVLILLRATSGASPPKAKEKQPAKSDPERLVGWWTIVNNDSRRKGELWEIGKHQIIMNANLAGFRTLSHFHRLDATKSPKQIDINVTTVAGVYGPDVPIKADARSIGVIKGIYSLDDDGELRLCLGEMGKDRPAAFPEKPKPGEVLILHSPLGAKADGADKGKDKLQVLIDKVLAAHGCEDKLSKLQFTMTVKHSNGATVQYFIQPPDHFRSEEQQRGEATKLVTILFHNHKPNPPGVHFPPMNGRMWWKKHPNGEVEPIFFTGVEPKMEYWLDYVKFFGLRRVLRLKDADHRVTLLEEEIKVDARAAVGVEVTYAVPNKNFTPLLKMYFDKETHLLVKQDGNVVMRSPNSYSDYKKFDGIPIAQKEHDGYLEPVVTEFRAVEKFDAKLFEQP
jgi:uncharacterized protein (TIGR03067 family)